MPPNQKTAFTPTTKRAPRTTEEVLAEQKADAERDHAKAQANLPAKATSTAVAVPDTRSPREQYLDDIAPAAIVGRMIRFDGKAGRYITTDDDEPVAVEGTDYVALCDQTLIGWMKFNGEGERPDRAMGPLYGGFVMPPRETLGNTDQSDWEDGLDGRPQDPWQHHVYLVLQRGDTGELFTLVTSSITGRRCIGNLLKHYDRLQQTHADFYPVVRLKVGGFNHRDPRVGWINFPVLAVVGRHPKDNVAKPDSSVAADMNDALPFDL
jgi:hypothetical protein